MATITVRLNEEEQEAFQAYATLHDIPLSTLFKQTLERQIEDEIDLAHIKAYEAELKEGTTEIHDHDTVMKMLGLSHAL
ncbi:hypothetical protein BW727_200015 (plasmid) [Jeotgalibaca dankookensis]|uniref:Uncharacterized protein n=1 Tax=Jeotgalibaca dankookensis TaxID=708126 RepID=A0A1S6IS85_9LACT|nr:DUF6290 family protein [Jeotgalibaca dankookensis]AQS54418.1 hypothetical protein BW727_200015 [Jeotgalibaca dankookensis]